MPYLGSLKISVVDCPWARMRLHWFLKGMEFTRSSCSSQGEGLPDRTAAAVQPLEEEKARLFAVVEDLQLGFVEGSLVVGYRLK